MQNPNQFTQSAEKGQMDLRFNSNIISGVIDSTEAGSLVAGQAVKLVDNTSKVPAVIACDENSDDVFGFIVYDIKTAAFTAGKRCEIAVFRDNVMYMESGAAIAKGAEVAIVIVDEKVITAVATDRIVGRSYDKATAAGQMIRVVIDLPGLIKA